MNVILTSKGFENEITLKKIMHKIEKNACYTNSKKI